ncbi:glycerophosphodiester phosphodiesterase [Pediococcus stilesii]|uniref:Glycerophosphodiester phosphodiesterase n=1 Tax=Pediococcus stilesii TaxID=331679 RepID=A0A5R9BVC5_9LACO|nr:glycerophosphodiester phosphodiesterase [Pediococcus stilesii]TLQ04656.1 glycerophosphodiester phosphodiesterase [Pediococcus stilesii]
MITQIIAHRGSKGTRPENTLAAFNQAIDDGADGIETDVHLSSDGELIIIHDETVNRTTNGEGRVFDKTLIELKQLDAGAYFSEKYINERIPTLEEVVDLLDQRKYRGIFNLELKTDKIKYPGIEYKVYDFFKNRSIRFHLVYSSFNPKTVSTMHKLQPDVEVASLFKINTKAARKFIRHKIIQEWHPSITWVRSHRFFLPHVALRPWTVNSAEDIRYCCKKRFKGIITDYPARALKIRKEIQGE